MSSGCLIHYSMAVLIAQHLVKCFYIVCIIRLYACIVKIWVHDWYFRDISYQVFVQKVTTESLCCIVHDCFIQYDTHTHTHT